MRVPVHRIKGNPKQRQETCEDVLSAALAQQFGAVGPKSFEHVDASGRKQQLDVGIAMTAHKLAVEVQETQNDKAIMAEMARERILRDHGWGVCRFTEKEIRGDIDSVLYKVKREIERRKRG